MSFKDSFRPVIDTDGFLAILFAPIFWNLLSGAMHIYDAYRPSDLHFLVAEISLPD